MKQFNKASAGGLAAAIVGLVGVLFEVEPEVLAAISTVLTAVIVYLVPNKES